MCLYYLRNILFVTYIMNKTIWNKHFCHHNVSDKISKLSANGLGHHYLQEKRMINNITNEKNKI